MLGHNTKMTGAQCLADMLKGYGVSHVFMVPAVLRRTFADMERRTDIKRIHCHGEKSAAYMADGHASASVPPFGPAPDERSVRAAVEALQKAERPVIVAGGGARASQAGAELIALAEALQIPVATSLNGKDTIPGTHPLCVGVVGSYSRESANRVVNRADLVCFIGTETGGMTTHFWAVPKIGTPAIQIDIDPEALGRNYPCVAMVNVDAKLSLAAVGQLADRATTAKRRAWIDDAQSICKEWDAKYD